MGGHGKMRDKLTTYAFKFGLVLLLLTVAMLFIVTPGTAESYITWVTFGLLTLFDGGALGAGG
jgi:hypothetical protein